jgi:lysophospholipase L1-like esterase
MTIRLLTPYDKYPVNSIVTLDAGTEAGLIAAKMAQADTTGGTPYVAPTAPNQLVPAQLSVDPFGNVLGLQGPTGKVQSISGNQANTLAVIGDSITANWYFQSALAPSVTPRGYLSWALALSKQRMQVVGSFATGGSRVVGPGGTLPTISTQIDSAVATGAKNLLLGPAGVNDFTGGNSLADVKAALTIIVQKAIAAGMRIWWCTLIPVGSPGGSYSVATQANIVALNDWIRSQAAAYAKAGVVLIDLYSVFVDPTSATGSCKSNYLGTDQLHPNNIGAYYGGKELARIWSANLPEVPRLLCSAADNRTYSAVCTNLVDNGLFTAGTALGTGYATVLGGGAAVTPSLVSRADGFGKDQVLDCTFAAAGDIVRLNAPRVEALVATGKTYVVDVELTLASPVNVRDITVDISVSGGSATQKMSWMATDPTNSIALPEGFTMQVSTPPMTIDAAAGAFTTVRAGWAATANGAGSCQLKGGRLSFREVLPA